MRNFTPWLVLSTLVFASTSAYLYWQLAAERARARRELASETGLRGEVERLEEVRAGLETDLRAARNAPPSAGPPLATSAAPSSSPRPAPDLMPPAGLLRVPEMTEEQRQWLTRRRYQSIFRELGLSEAEIAAVLPVLVQQDLRANKPLPKELAGRPDELAQRDQAELAATLGVDKADRFTAQRKLLPVRSDVRMLRMRLEDSEEPLSAEQQDALLTILANRSNEPGPPRIEGEDRQQSHERLTTWMRERDQRLQKDAAPVLTTAQRKLLEEDAQFQDALRARSAFMGGSAVNPQAGSSAPASRSP